MLRIPKLQRRRNINAIAVLTSGGDAPGMNSAIRAVVRTAVFEGCKVFGVQRGYTGLLEGEFIELHPRLVANTLQRGGTLLRTSRCKAFHTRSVRKEAANLLRRKEIGGLIVIGGDGSYRGAHLLEKENRFPVIGVPGTIDNDIPETDETIGFDTAVNTAVEAIDRIRDTATSHERLFLVEVMGRNSGFIAAHVGIGGGAETVVVPEQKYSLSKIRRAIDQGIKRGKTSSIVVVAEGEDAGLSVELAADLEERGYSPRVCILGHIQRGGTPTAHDRFLASSLGASAVRYLLAGRSGAAVGVQKNEICLSPLKKIVRGRKTLDRGVMDLAKILAV